MSDNTAKVKPVNSAAVSRSSRCSRVTVHRYVLHQSERQVAAHFRKVVEQLLLLLSLEHLQTVKLNSEEGWWWSKTHIYYRASGYIIKTHQDSGSFPSSAI